MSYQKFLDVISYFHETYLYVLNNKPREWKRNCKRNNFQTLIIIPFGHLHSLLFQLYVHKFINRITFFWNYISSRECTNITMIQRSDDVFSTVFVWYNRNNYILKVHRAAEANKGQCQRNILRGLGYIFCRAPKKFIVRQICSSVTRPLIKINLVGGAGPARSFLSYAFPSVLTRVVVWFK